MLCKLWHSPYEAPACCAGDRVVIVVNEREDADSPLGESLVILTAKEAGWGSGDDLYSGYSPCDGERWAYEKDLLNHA